MTTRPKFPDGELSLLLCEQLGWRGGLALDGAPLPARGIATGEKLRLTADPRGPLALTSADGSLGRLRLPRGMALDADLTLHLLTERPCSGGTDAAIWRFDATRQRFERLPEVGGCVPNDDSLPDARQFHAGSAVAILGKALYVADPVSARVQVFDLTTLALRYVWHTPRQSGRSDSERWQPVDVAASAQQVYILDQAHGRVYRHQPSSDALDLLIDLPNERGGAWTRIAVDRDERLYPYDAANAVLEIFAYDEDDGWCPVGTADDAGDVRERFDPPAITVEQRPDATRWFALPACLRRSAGRQLPGATKPPVGETCDPPDTDDLYFDFATAGQIALTPEQRVGLASYQRSGEWITTMLDSELYNCQWHRLVLEIDRLPPGSRVAVWTYASADQQPDELISTIPDESWQRAISVVGAMQADESETNHLTRDGLVQSREGQYLWLRVRLWSDGYDTPEISTIRAYFPRDSYLKYLPAVYSQDEDSRWFLERYLSIIQTEWDALERNIRDSRRFFDPEAVPGGAALEYLASWFALPLEGEWTDEQKRRMLVGARRVYGRRGTLKGLQAWLQIYLANLSEVSPEDQETLGVPALLESYRARSLPLTEQHDQAPDDGDASEAAQRLGDAPLWSDQAANRFQLGVNSRADEAQIVSIGDPQIDMLSRYAHRFTVYVPAAWVRTAADERMLRRAIDAEKPAYTQYDLHLVEARFRIGVQATLDVDAVVGALPTPQPLRDEPEQETNLPPSQAAGGRLGYDTVLEQSSPGISSAHRKAPRLGLDTHLS
ncbi:MAG: phage tail protein [Anaerolineae bacterium]